MVQACPLRKVHRVHVRPLRLSTECFIDAHESIFFIFFHLFVDRDCRERRTRCARGIHLSHRNIMFGIKWRIYTFSLFTSGNDYVFFTNYGQTSPVILLLESSIALLIIFFLEYYYKIPEMLLNKEQCRSILVQMFYCYLLINVFQDIIQ